MSGNPDFSELDAHQILQRAFNESEDRLRVDTEATISGGSFEVSINHVDDSVKVGDGTDFLAVNADGSINVVLQDSPATNIEVVEKGLVDTGFNEITSVSSNTLTNIISYTAVQNTRLKSVQVSGTNIAEYSVWINGLIKHKKRTFFNSLDANFDFLKGMSLVSGDVVLVKVEHFRPDLGNFSAFLMVLKNV